VFLYYYYYSNCQDAPVSCFTMDYGVFTPTGSIATTTMTTTTTTTKITKSSTKSNIIGTGSFKTTSNNLFFSETGKK
jgi:hypothetical protein